MKNSPIFKQGFTLPSFSSKNSGGFTLIEILVAIGIFSIVTTIAVGGFVRALRAHRLTLAIIAANSNISYAIERMAKEIRTGSGFEYGGTSLCSTTGVLLCFDNADGDSVEYALSADSITRNSQKITDSNVIVDYLYFNKYDSLTSYPARVSINVGIKPKIEGASASTINIQTTVSGRW